MPSVALTTFGRVLVYLFVANKLKQVIQFYRGLIRHNAHVAGMAFHPRDVFNIVTESRWYNIHRAVPIFV
jgi:hypothetical protein